MKIKEIIITDNIFNTIAKLNSRIEFENYMKKNPNTFATNISINNIAMNGFDEIYLFFNCKTIKQFLNLIN